ncbi:unnamed protein product [Phytophthora lilii]|uniref:Unnamed protein product n=1 Tax=Phytophthora lilii TaxID=2077276 RepID=A0A9W6TTL0_9STRA|nr:unnamed protein product [Phytophthora lilii]
MTKVEAYPIAKVPAPLDPELPPPTTLSLLEELSPDSSPTVAALSDDADPIDPIDPFPLHMVATESRMSVWTDTFEPGIVQSPRFSAATSSIRAMQEELLHTAITWSIVRVEMVETLTPVSVVQPARLALLASPRRDSVEHSSALAMLAKARPITANEVRESILAKVLGDEPECATRGELKNERLEEGAIGAMSPRRK